MKEFEQSSMSDDHDLGNTDGAAPASRHGGETPHNQADVVERISVETLVAVMVRKGLCTEAELLEEENLRRAESGRFQDSQYLRIDNDEVNAEHWGRPQHPLRKMFARFRWSRRLGTAIFGWKWKKLKKDHSLERMH